MATAGIKTRPYIESSILQHLRPKKSIAFLASLCYTDIVKLIQNPVAFVVCFRLANRILNSLLNWFDDQYEKGDLDAKTDL